jgi:hypothetical protein
MRAAYQIVAKPAKAARGNDSVGAAVDSSILNCRRT